MTSPEKPEPKDSTPEAGSSASSPAVTTAGETGAAPSAKPSAPPPWQRVASDIKAEQAEQSKAVGDDNRAAGAAGPEPATVRVDSAEVAGVDRDAKTERFEDWGYTKASSGHDNGAPAEQAGGYSPAMADAATSSVYAGQRIGSLPKAESGLRTTVNFGSSGGASSGGTPLGAASGAPAGTPIRPSSPPPTALRRPGRGPRRASLQVRRVDPWSVLKLAFVLSVALFFVWMVAVGVLYGVLDGMGVWDKLNGTYNEFAVNTTAASNGPLITVGRVLGIAAIVGAINIVLFTALATVGAFVYNVSADLAGGLEVTLAERE